MNIKQGKQRIYSPGSTFIVRIAGLPMQVLAGLRFHQTIKLIEEVYERENWLKSHARLLSDALYSIIGTVDDRRIRRHLIELRRSIFQLQMPGKADLNEQVWAILPTDITAQIKRWLECLESQLEQLARGQTILEAEIPEKRHMLRSLASSQHFQQGLVLASKDLYAELPKWLQETWEVTTHDDRKFELGLLAYLSRVATKTSPYSTFTSIAQGSWIDDDSVLTSTITQGELRRTIELNWSIVYRIASALAQWTEIKQMLTLKVNSSLLEEENTLRFLGWKGAEVMIKLAKTPTLQHILSLVRSTPNPSFQTIVQLLALEDSRHTSSTIEGFLEHLCSIGLLGVDFAIPDHTPDYLGVLLERLAKFHSPRVESISALLHSLHMNIQKYIQIDPPSERLQLMNTIYTTLSTVFHQLGLNERNELPGKNAFYENTINTNAEIRYPLKGWREVLDDLSVLQELSGLYNGFLPGRLALSAFFVDHFGKDTSVALLHFYETFCHEGHHDAGWRKGYRVSGAHLLQLFENPRLASTIPLSEFDAITALQDEIAQWSEKQVLQSTHCQLDRTAILAFIARFPPYIPLPRSLDMYGQLFFQDAKPYFVLNAMHTGFGRYHSRFTRLLSCLDIPVDFAPPDKAPDSEEPLYAEIQGVFGTNVNLRTPHTSYEIAYPGCVSMRPLEKQILLSDLQVAYDPRTRHLRLISSGLKREIVPVHLGQAAHFWLPPMYRFLIQAFSEGIADATPIRLYRWEKQTSQAVLRFPRIYLGHIVFERASWIMDLRSLPPREKGETIFSYMLKIHSWRQTHHIPQECFVRALPPASGPNQKGKAKDSLFAKMNKKRKPLYIDFANYWSILLFEQMIRQIDGVIIVQEILPCKDELVLSSNNAAYASECILELNYVEQDNDE